MSKFIICKETGKIIDAIIDDIPIKETELIVDVDFFEGLYEPVYDIKTNTFIEGKPSEEINVIKNSQDLDKEVIEIQQWFEDTDYICFKVLRGNWAKTDARYKQYLKDYEVKSARLNEIEAQKALI